MKYALLVFLGGCSYGILSTIVKIAYAAGLTPAEVCGGQVFSACFCCGWRPCAIGAFL